MKTIALHRHCGAQKGGQKMKAGIIFKGKGPILILTTYESFKDPKLISKLKKKGITPRKTIDLLITTYCIHNKLFLLYSDRDFDPLINYLNLKNALSLPK